MGVPGSESALRQLISPAGNRHHEHRPGIWYPPVPGLPLVVVIMPPRTTALLILTHRRCGPHTGWRSTQVLRQPGPLAIYRAPQVASRPRSRSSEPALATRSPTADPAQRRRVQRACQHRQPAARYPDHSGRRGLVGTLPAGHHRARMDTHRALHRRAPPRDARLSPSKGPTRRPGPGMSHARLRPAR